MTVTSIENIIKFYCKYWKTIKAICVLKGKCKSNTNYTIESQRYLITKWFRDKQEKQLLVADHSMSLPFHNESPSIPRRLKSSNLNWLDNAISVVSCSMDKNINLNTRCIDWIMNIHQHVVSMQNKHKSTMDSCKAKSK